MNIPTHTAGVNFSSVAFSANTPPPNPGDQPRRRIRFVTRLPKIRIIGASPAPTTPASNPTSTPTSPPVLRIGLPPLPSPPETTAQPRRNRSNRSIPLMILSLLLGGSGMMYGSYRVNTIGREIATQQGRIDTLETLPQPPKQQLDEAQQQLADLTTKQTKAGNMAVYSALAGVLGSAAMGLRRLKPRPRA